MASVVRSPPRQLSVYCHSLTLLAPLPDCCDGSDESQHSSVQCDNTCEAVAEEYRRIQAERIRRLEEGARAKLAYVTQGNEVRVWLWFVFLLCAA